MSRGAAPAKSNRDLIRDYAEEMLRQAGTPLHNSQIAEQVLARLGAAHQFTPKDVNTCLHDDPQNRFKRVAKGTWTLKSFQA